MSELITRTARLVPYSKRPKQVPSFVTAYYYEPPADDESSHLGNLYIVIEVLTSGRASEEVADLIIESLGEHYYNNQSEETDPLRRFEHAVKSVNHQLADYVNQGNASWIGKLSAVAAVIAGNELHLTSSGSAEGFLYRGKAHTKVTSNSNRPVGPTKTFSSIASGQIETSDRILLATPAVVHQVALTRLHNIVSQNSPSSAIAELTHLLEGANNERIAAIVVEITTPELAAMQVRSDEPNEIDLGTSDSPLEAAKVIAAPIAQTALQSTRRATDVARSGAARVKPHATSAGLAAAGWLRNALQDRRMARQLGIGVAVVVIGIGALAFVLHGNGNAKKLTDRYNQDFTRYQSITASGNPDKAATSSSLDKLQTELISLSKDPGRKSLDRHLAKAQLAPGEPTSVAAFLALVSNQIDQLEGLVMTSPTTVVSFKTARPNHMEQVGGKIYLVDQANNSAIYVVNTSTNSLTKSSADTSALGKVVATTVSSTGDGMYLLTSAPGVWFYDFSGDSLTRVSTSLDGWETAQAIASYTGNLYTLGSNIIYKHLRTQAGFGPKADYLDATKSSALSGASALAVDGSVYVMTPQGLLQYLSGNLKQTVETPAALKHATILRSTDNGNTLVVVDSSTRRLGLFDASGSSVVFNKQYNLNGIKAMYDGTYDPTTKTVYALVDGRLVKFTR